MKGRAVMSSMLDLPIAAMPVGLEKEGEEQTAHPDKGTESALCPTSTGRGPRALRAGDVRADDEPGCHDDTCVCTDTRPDPGPDPGPDPDLTRSGPRLRWHRPRPR